MSPVKLRQVSHELLLTLHGKNAKFWFCVVSTGADKKNIQNLKV